MNKIFRIRADNERYYLKKEDEILYIESCHNKVIWHCKNELIVANDSLRHLEGELSPSFVRIQRSYIVNRRHVIEIRRCELVVSNRDVLPIPYKKYVHVREELLRNMT